MTIRHEDAIRVASACGVDGDVVADIMAGRGRHPTDVVLLVRRTMRRLGIRPTARGLAQRRERTGQVGFAVPDVGEPFFSELASLLVRAAGARGWSVTIQQTDSVRDKELDVLNGVGLPPMDGLIHVPRSVSVADLTRRVNDSPLVLLSASDGLDPFSTVEVDNRAAAVTAVSHLIDAGRRRIVHLGPRPATPSTASRQRHEGYLDALAAAGLKADPSLIRDVEAFSADEGLRVIRVLLATGVEFDAVFCSSDSVALGAMRALHDGGRRVPDDVAVVGIDDIAMSRFTTPSLSSVAPDKTRLVEAALDLLESQIAAPATAWSPASHVVVPHRLVVRDSTRVSPPPLA